MRVVSWNCAGALSKKLTRLLDLQPDIAIIQECEQLPQGLPRDAAFEWIGRNPRKGLGVLSFCGAPLKSAAYREAWCYFLPIEVAQWKVLAVWAFNQRSHHIGPDLVGNIRCVLGDTGEWLQSGCSIVAGDFNNSPIWDRPGGDNNFATIDADLAKLGLRSAVHEVSREPLGKETAHTLFHLKNPEKGYHIDYVYVHRGLNVAHAQVLPFSEWRELSDHTPLVVDLFDPACPVLAATCEDAKLWVWNYSHHQTHLAKAQITVAGREPSVGSASPFMGVYAHLDPEEWQWERWTQFKR